VVHELLLIGGAAAKAGLNRDRASAERSRLGGLSATVGAGHILEGDASGFEAGDGDAER
jgi:hypothetical protein